MDAKTHWEKVYTTKEPEAVSWYRPQLETSLVLVERAAHSHSTSIIDIGAGESTLVDDLLARGYESITVLDVSQTALEVTKMRLGLLAQNSWSFSFHKSQKSLIVAGPWPGCHARRIEAALPTGPL